MFIQMKTQLQECARPAGARSSKQSVEQGDIKLFRFSEAARGGQGKKGPQSGSSATSSRATKKTAHRLVERRRRDKTNEAFAVLESMIPACTGNVHKLAILQASIDYIRYLENCLAKLKWRLGDHQSWDKPGHVSLPFIRDFHAEPRGRVELFDSDIASPIIAGQLDRARHPSTPSPEAKDTDDHQLSCSSVLTYQNHHRLSSSVAPLPAFSPQSHGMYSPSSAPGPRSTSPPRNKPTDLDYEAAAALLMFSTHGQYTNVIPRSRGLSVHDLLCT
ncbi:HLH transcription factor [Pochonia chlamydosporia 170]|uniref:HLH transcription factor n=1 Tax=Pochonia chlamydosporia 170 TaxID=1380566 RepID=A0A179F0K6_METCM|nr:HLH transcription factor [Pochonia chlamydosporia 170]OAQ58961.1 HLH transcription factor [Pochonia chlamydosporia 170]